MMQHLEDGTQAEMQNLFTFHIYLAYWPETNFTHYFWYTYSLPINYHVRPDVEFSTYGIY